MLDNGSDIHPQREAPLGCGSSRTQTCHFRVRKKFFLIPCATGLGLYFLLQGLFPNTALDTFDCNAAEPKVRKVNNSGAIVSFSNQGAGALQT